MSSTYNLNDNVKENFSFTIGEHTYLMRYPTLEEVEKIQETTKKSPENSEALLGTLGKFITPQGDAPPIEKIMQKQNIRVINNFTEMIKAEFGAE